MTKYFYIILIMIFPNLIGGKSKMGIGNAALGNTNTIQAVQEKGKKFIPDTSVNSFKLSSNTGLFDSQEQFLDSINGGNGPFWYYLILTSNKNQILRMSFYPGGNYDNFSYFEVFYVSPTDYKNLKYTIIKSNDLKTESGVHLGMSRQELIEIKGESFNKSESTDNLIVYEFEEGSELDDFLSKYNEIGYKAKYNFKNDKLVRYEFGFELP